MKLKLTPKFITHSGRQGANARILSENAKRRIHAHHRAVLRRGGAYARGVIRKSLGRPGRTTKERVYDHKQGQWLALNSRRRKRSKPPNPPMNHAKSAFGLKWVRFDDEGFRNWRVIVGPEVSAGRAKGAWKSKFDVASHLEAGGSGKVMLPNRPDSQAAFWQLYHATLKHGGSLPSVWKDCFYPKRPYVEPALQPTLRFIRKIYNRRLITKQGKVIPNGTDI